MKSVTAMDPIEGELTDKITYNVEFTPTKKVAEAKSTTIAFKEESQSAGVTSDQLEEVTHHLQARTP
ncbi:hypothetical protein [Candidatus Enterococcus mansonii]|uniref:Uncharacterized protein n=1 Tax=Candidatus Enterococcus mansonii TaxID=1834181 RepID=A0A242CDG5_9ENTE|nr:hypothetical protein [Enterococcus sp. 4G2_DIV0659]OTO07960.1 hypothetical protein A5880_002230 [Enterococcus sp. 4G2_DIV0659]